MFIFGLMIIINVSQLTLRRVQPVTITVIIRIGNRDRRSQSKTDDYLFIMFFMQVILLTLFSLRQIIENLYSNITLYNIKPSLIISINNFIFNLFLLLTYVTNGMPFYIYTLTGRTICCKALLNEMREFICTLLFLFFTNISIDSES